jgi:predicted transcriptional regulator YheO
MESLSGQKRNGLIKFLECFYPIVDGIAEFLGSDCEVVLHDVSNPEHSIIRIRNGHVTHRKIGDSLTDLGLQLLNNRGDAHSIGNYNPRTKDGRLLKSSCIFIRNIRGKLVGFICINMDIERMQQLKDSLNYVEAFITDLCGATRANACISPEENFEPDLWSLVKQLIDQVIGNGRTPPRHLTRAMKLEVVKVLNDRGVFMVKGSVAYVSEFLGLSMSTLYRYLGELKVPKMPTDSS